MLEMREREGSDVLGAREHPSRRGREASKHSAEVAGRGWVVMGWVLGWVGVGVLGWVFGWVGSFNFSFFTFRFQFSVLIFSNEQLKTEN